MLYLCTVEPNIYKMSEQREELMTAAEPVATMSESVSRSGLLGQVMRLGHDDKVALIRYLRQDTGQDEATTAFDEFGRVVLTKTMRESVHTAERAYDEGKCLSEEQFQQRFAKWL